MGQPLYLRGEERKLIDGRKVVVVERAGGGWKVINPRGYIEIVWPRQFIGYDEEKRGA